MSMTEKLLNKIRQKLLLMIMTKKIFHVATMLIMKNMRMKHFSHDEDDDKTQQVRKLYVLHVMIETTTTITDPKLYMFCMS